MFAVLVGFLFITVAAFIVPYMMAGANKELGTSRGIGVASTVGVIYVLIVAVVANN